VSTAGEGAPAPLDVGILLVGVAGGDAARGITRLLTALRRRFHDLAPGLRWRCHLVTPAAGEPTASDPRLMSLLDLGLNTLARQRLDFVYVLHAGAMRNERGQPVDAAVSSAAGIAMLAALPLRRVDAADALAQRMVPLLARMAGLDAAVATDAREAGALRAALQRIADARIEERARRGRIAFHLAALGENWRPVLGSIARLRPWTMPLRLGRLTAAAVSVLLLLMMTAEAWELGVAQSPARVAALSMLVLCATSAYVLRRQRLLRIRAFRGLTEQLVVMRVAISAAIVLGLLSTYLALFAFSFGAGLALFPDRVATHWSGIDPPRMDWAHYALMAGFVSAIGVIMGALGASFEPQRRLKEWATIDEIRLG
jgi:hypothetical protein